MGQEILALLILGMIVVCFLIPKIPLSVTAIFGAIAMAAFGIISFKDSISSFGSDTVMMVAGMSVVGGALKETGCADFLASKILQAKGVEDNERKFIAILFLVVAVLSGFMSNTATVAVFLPVVASIAHVSKGKIKVKNTFMAIGVASVLGGNLTLAGSTPQMVVQGVLSQTEGATQMKFFDLTKGALPIILIGLIYFVSFGYKLQEKVFDFTEVVHELKHTGKEVIDKKKMSISLLILLGCVIAFALDIFTLGTIALIGAGLSIVTGCISEKKAYDSIDWTSIMVLGGSMGFSKGLDKSGAVELISNSALEIFGGQSAHPWVIFGVLLVISAILGNFMSHTATAAVMGPIAINLALAIGVNPMAYAIGIVIGCNLSSATPVATPPLTLTLQGGYRFRDYLVVGGILNIILVVAAVILIPIIYGFV